MKKIHVVQDLHVETQKPKGKFCRLIETNLIGHLLEKARNPRNSRASLISQGQFRKGVI